MNSQFISSDITEDCEPGRGHRINNLRGKRNVEREKNWLKQN